MKFLTTVLGLLAVASPIICDNTSTACTADQVIVSLTTNNHFADQMQADVDDSNSSIDPSGPVYKNFRTILRHLNSDINCPVNATHEDQAQICGAFVTFAEGQLRYLHVADGLKFYQANSHGENEAKMREYILQYKAGLEGYKDRIRAGVPNCADQIDMAYSPLSDQFDTLLQEYPSMQGGSRMASPTGRQTGSQ